jgi:hypothetical protein
MWVLVMVVCAAFILLACEKWIGRYPATYQDESAFLEKSLPERFSSKEVAFRLLPFFFGGIGLPLYIAHPLPGILCLILALGLFLVGRKMNI